MTDQFDARILDSLSYKFDARTPNSDFKVTNQQAKEDFTGCISKAKNGLYAKCFANAIKPERLETRERNLGLDKFVFKQMSKRFG